MIYESLNRTCMLYTYVYNSVYKGIFRVRRTLQCIVNIEYDTVQYHNIIPTFKN